MVVSSETNIGKVRSINQDACFISTGVPSYIVVADGMGGHKAGEVASSVAVECIKSFLTPEKIKESENINECISESIEYANHEIFNMASENDDYAGMGTTIVMCYFKDNEAHIANVGDSRAYLIRENNIKQISTDHSVVQELYESGKIKREEMRNHPNKNLITRVVGTQSDVKCDIFTIDMKADDIIFLCSDGLTDMLEDEQILDIFSKASDVGIAVKDLIDEANKAGGYDNITVAAAKF